MTQPKQPQEWEKEFEERLFEENGWFKELGNGDEDWSSVKSFISRTRQEAYRLGQEEMSKVIPEILLEGWEISSTVKATLGEAFQKRFNKTLDYDQWVGIQDFLDSCAGKIAERINERIALNKEALSSLKTKQNER